MSIFGFRSASDRYGVIVDIGSGSVLAAVVHSDPNRNHPDIVWSHREHTPLRNVDSLEHSSKAVMAALVTVLMKLDAEGRKVLYEYDPDAKFTDLQCSISAPWSYTVTKTINYKQEKDFTVSKDLIAELVQTVHEKVEADLKENEALQNLGLQVTTRAMLGVTANGYRVEEPEGERANELVVSHTSVVAQKYLIDAISEMHEKLFVGSECKKLSFILMLFSVTREVLSQTYDVCLIDVTYEATEIGVVRDGILNYSTHTPFGVFSLAREISAATNVPLHEAFGYLHTENPYGFMEKLNDAQRKDVEEIFESYIKKLSELLHETGDVLSIPKQISLHTDMNSEPLFLNLIDKAARRSIKVTPDINVISKEIIEKTFKVAGEEEKIPSDTALLLSAQFFHMNPKQQTFDYF